MSSSLDARRAREHRIRLIRQARASNNNNNNNDGSSRDVHAVRMRASRQAEDESVRAARRAAHAAHMRTSRQAEDESVSAARRAADAAHTQETRAARTVDDAPENGDAEAFCAPINQDARSYEKFLKDNTWMVSCGCCAHEDGQGHMSLLSSVSLEYLEPIRAMYDVVFTDSEGVRYREAYRSLHGDGGPHRGLVPGADFICHTCLKNLKKTHAQRRAAADGPPTSMHEARGKSHDATKQYNNE